MDCFDSVSASEAGAWLHLTNLRTDAPAYVTGKDGTPDLSKPMRIKLIGMDAPAAKAKERKRTTSILKRRGGKMDFAKMTEAQLGALVDEGQEGIVQAAVDQTIGWENLSLDGKPVEFSEEAAFAIYRKYPSILDEVTEFLKDRANFFAQA
jgi:hypothetical protein